MKIYFYVMCRGIFYIDTKLLLPAKCLPADRQTALSGSPSDGVVLQIMKGRGNMFTLLVEVKLLSQ